MRWFAAWTFPWGWAGWERGLGPEAWAAEEGTRLPWRPGLERNQLLIGLAVEIQVTFAEGKWTGDSGAAVLEERAAAVGEHLFVEAEILVAGVVRLEEEAVVVTVAQAEVQSEISVTQAELVEARASAVKV